MTSLLHSSTIPMSPYHLNFSTSCTLDKSWSLPCEQMICAKHFCKHWMKYLWYICWLTWQFCNFAEICRDRWWPDRRPGDRRPPPHTPPASRRPPLSSCLASTLSGGWSMMTWRPEADARSNCGESLSWAASSAPDHCGRCWGHCSLGARSWQCSLQSPQPQCLSPPSSDVIVMKYPLDSRHDSADVSSSKVSTQLRGSCRDCKSRHGPGRHGQCFIEAAQVLNLYNLWPDSMLWTSMKIWFSFQTYGLLTLIGRLG